MNSRITNEGINEAHEILDLYRTRECAVENHDVDSWDRAWNVVDNPIDAYDSIRERLLYAENHCPSCDTKYDTRWKLCGECGEVLT